MLYVVITKDKPDSLALRNVLCGEHLGDLDANRHRVLAAGGGGGGGVIVDGNGIPMDHGDWFHVEGADIAIIGDPPAADPSGGETPGNARRLRWRGPRRQWRCAASRPGPARGTP